MRKQLAIHRYVGVVQERIAQCDEMFTKSEVTILLGARQQSQYSKLTGTRLNLFKSFLPTLAKSQLDKLKQVGTELACGYRPGSIQDEEMFDKMASNISVGSKYIKKAKLVLHGGEGVNDVAKGAVERERVHQACVTISRIMADGLREKKKEIVKTALTKIKRISAEKISPIIVLSVFLNMRPETLKKKLEGDGSDFSYMDFSFSFLVTIIPDHELKLFIEMYAEALEWIEQYRYENRMSSMNVCSLMDWQDGKGFSQLQRFIGGHMGARAPDVPTLERLVTSLEKTVSLSGDAFRKKIIDGYKRLTGKEQRYITAFRAKRIQDEIKRGHPIMETIMSIHKKADASSLSNRLRKWQKESPNRYWINV